DPTGSRHVLSAGDATCHQPLRQWIAFALGHSAGCESGSGQQKPILCQMRNCTGISLAGGNRLRDPDHASMCMQECCQPVLLRAFARTANPTQQEMAILGQYAMHLQEECLWFAFAQQDTVGNHDTESLHTAM